MLADAHGIFVKIWMHIDYGGCRQTKKYPFESA